MLYEVITNYIPTSFALKHGVDELSSGSVIEVQAPLQADGEVAVSVQNLNIRITSYNVCYTKLLRLTLISDYKSRGFLPGHR